jgi:hypothetical protein
MHHSKRESKPHWTRASETGFMERNWDVQRDNLPRVRRGVSGV